MPRRLTILSAPCLCLVAAAPLAGECADTNGDDEVNITDLLAVISDWGECDGCSGDLDGSGIVDVGDLIAVLDDWGECADWDNGDGPFNYGDALQKALTFYMAQRAGDLPDNYPLNWRGDCFDEPMEQINGSYPVDEAILNRYMDAGDTPTFVLPISFSMTTLAWSGIEFGHGYTQADQMDDLKDVLRWHANWCIAAHPEPNVFCGQIGQGGPSHSFWGPPEIHTQATEYRPKIWWLTPQHPGTEPAAEAAAFLAAASIVFEADEPEYAATLLTHAQDLYTFADTYRARYTSSIPDAAAFYNSWSGYHDELAWAAIWLHRATGTSSYLDRARAHYTDASLDANWAQSWDGKINGAALLLAHATGEQQYQTDLANHLSYWMPGGGIAYTSGGLAWLDTWGSLRYAANTSFIALATAHLLGDEPDGRYRTFAQSQINYMLGDNPRNASYVCGFGDNPPQSPHHRGAHGSWNNQVHDPAPNRHTLWGALVGGPASADDLNYVDDRTDYIANEVACDYNAGFTAALAWLSSDFGGEPLPDDQFPPVEDAYGKEMFVEASVIESTDRSTVIRCLLNNRSAWPARVSDQLSYRIYLDLTEVLAAGLGPEDVLIESGYLDGGSIQPLIAIDLAANIYAFDISYVGEVIGPGGSTSWRRECQVRVGLDHGAPAGVWDATNDPSIRDLPIGHGAIIQSSAIVVFEAGQYIYGDLID